MFVAKREIEKIIRKRKQDRFSLVIFAGEAATWVPLTLDQMLLRTLLKEVEVGMLKDGTAIGNAVGTALNRLRRSEAKTRVVILLTDGDNNAGTLSPRQAAALAAEKNIRVYPILIGRGGKVPFPAGKDIFGREVYEEREMPVNPELLEEIAAETGGRAYRAEDEQELSQKLAEVLDDLDKTRLQSGIQSRQKAEAFLPWLFLALSFFVGEFLLRQTRFRRLL